MRITKKTMAELDRVSCDQYKKLPKNPVIVILDNVRSAHNVGSVFRTCDAFLIQKLYLCGITPTPPNPEIHKTALGATDSVEWEYYEDVMEIVKKLKNEGVFIYSVEQAHNSIDLENLLIDKNQKCAVIFGHEVYGVHQQILEISDCCIEIAQSGTKHSLNISVSAGIVLYKFFAQYKHL